MPYETGDSPRDPSLKEEARSVADAAKAGYEELREEVKQGGEEVLSGAKQKAYETAETQQQLIGENLEAVAIALKASVDSLRDQGQDRMADYWRVASDGVDSLAKRLKDKPLPEMWMEAERYVREQPGFAFGGAVAAGFLLSRFLKSSSSPDSTARRAPRDVI
jgi:hypothetical protein